MAYRKQCVDQVSGGFQLEDARFPWNNREGLLYGGIIAGITAHLMALFNMSRSIGDFRPEYIIQVIPTYVVVWVVVMLLMTFVVGRIADWFIGRYVDPSDSANVRILANIVVCVTFMSMIMSAIGPIVGTAVDGHLSLEQTYRWIYNWPYNFCTAFWIEMVLAQPAARLVMRRMHTRALGRTCDGGAADE